MRCVDEQEPFEAEITMKKTAAGGGRFKGEREGAEGRLTKETMSRGYDILGTKQNLDNGSVLR